MKTKIIPFDLETAKKIQAGEIKGKIKTREGYDVRVICWDWKCIDFEIVALVTIEDMEECHVYQIDGKVWKDQTSNFELVLEVPDNERQFQPFDKVLVRDSDKSAWRPRLYSRKGRVGYCTQDCCEYMQILPYEGNEHLVGTTVNPIPKEE